MKPAKKHFDDEGFERPGLVARAKAAWAILRAGPMSGAASWFALGLDLVAGRNGSLQHPYKNSVWVSRAIKKVAGPISAVPVEVYRAEQMAALRGRLSRAGVVSPGSKALSPKSVVRLAIRAGYLKRDAVEEVTYDVAGLAGWLREPAARLSWSDFIEASVGWLKLKGEIFWIQGQAGLPFQDAANGWPKTLMARPDRMREILQGDDLLGWEFADRNGRRWPVLDSNVVQTKCWNPYDEFRGLADWEAARIAADADYLAGKFKRDLMANNGDTGPIVGLKNGASLTDDQVKQVREQLREKRRLQQQGIFAPVFLPGEVTVEDPKVRGVDTAYVSVRLEDRHEIAVAFGVPPSMFDVAASYSIGSASDFYQLISDTCVPVGEKIADGLERLFKLISGQELEVHFNFDEHPVMRTVRRERIDSIEKLWSKGMPMSDINDYLDLNMPEFEGWKLSYLPFNVIQVSPGGLPDPASNPALADQVPASSPAVAAAVRALTEGRNPKAEIRRKSEGRNPRAESCACGCSLEEAAFAVSARSRDARELAQWKASVARRLPFIKGYRTKFDKVLMEARRQVLSKLERSGEKVLSPGSKVQSREARSGVAADFMFDLHDFKNLFHAAMRNIAAAAVQDAGAQVFEELDRRDPWKSPAKSVIDFMATREKKLADVPDEVYGRIKGRLTQGFEDGDTMAQLAKSVREEFNGISDGRGKVIAQTETAAAFGFGRHEAMVAASVRWKKWLTSGNDNVRYAHVLMNQVIVAIDEPFVCTNEKGDVDEVEHPADSDGEPWNVINCHCVEVASAEGPVGEAEESAEL